MSSQPTVPGKGDTLEEHVPYDPDEDWDYDEDGPAIILWGLAMVVVLSVVVVLSWVLHPIFALRRWWSRRRFGAHT